MVASYAQCLRLIGSTHEEKAVVLAIEIWDWDCLEGQSVQTADSVHQGEERKVRIMSSMDFYKGQNLLDMLDFTQNIWYHKLYVHFFLHMM